MAVFSDDADEEDVAIMEGLVQTGSVEMEVDCDSAQLSQLKEHGSRLAEAGEFAVNNL
jgi:hypothetical protein